MTPEEWESLCDGCGQCCMYKIEDEDTGELFNTSVCCHLFDPETGRCSDYAGRKQKVPDCQILTPERVAALGWLPQTCAYRLIHEGRQLYPWHPLRSGDPESVHRAGVSVRGRPMTPSDQVEDLTDHVVSWDLTPPDPARLLSRRRRRKSRSGPR
jgi:uncharacterized cysteine cluster protein YcgN (CxxCxxCC family)